MYQEGRERAHAMFAKAEEGGRAADAPYAQRLYRTYVLPVAEQIRQDCLVRPRVGRSQAHIVLLRDLDPDVVAFLAVRHTINAMMQPGDPTNHRQLGYGIGRTVHREMVLAQFAEVAPDLYYTLAHDFGRRMSKDERHRMTVFLRQAKQNGIDLQQWGIGSRDQIGLYILGLLEAVGLVTLDPIKRTGYKHNYRGVYLTPEVVGSIDAVKTFVAETTPVFGPCVEEPLPWHGFTGGGFHTEKLRRIHRYLIKTPPSSREHLREADLSGATAAVNALQRTRWAVNRDTLAVIMQMAERGIERAGVALASHEEPPEKPEWLRDTEKENMTPEQGAQFKAWKREMSQWYERRKARVAGYTRFYGATRQANFFSPYPTLHFVYFYDSRGRAYPLSYGLTPQGDDLQKGLLHFSEGFPLDSDDAIRWFLIHGANKFGFDKATLDEREQWARERAYEIRRIAQAPLDNLDGWAGCDNPVQFLAWCIEFDRWQQNPAEFVSHLPVSMDGSCNGLQHFSAMLRDEIGGKATNLTDNAVMEDVYRQVAEAATARLRAAPEDDAKMRSWWLKHGISRTVVKRSVMTTPYGVTRRTATRYIVSDYLAENGGDLDRDQWFAAAQTVMGVTWPAIGDVVVKSREAMDWLQVSASMILAHKGEGSVISWFTPDGFLATQAYFEMSVHEIRSVLHGKVRINVAADTDTPNAARHATAMAPNFVHSMDGCHMRMVTRRAAAEGIRDLAMIHDDYGTHAANAGRMFRIIREEFYQMYTEHDPLQAFAERYPEIGKPPEKGSLDLAEVLRADFFFS